MIVPKGRYSETMTDQLELDLQEPTYDHFTIVLAKGPLHGEEVVRTVTATSREDAEVHIEAFRESCHIRDSVEWDGEVIGRNNKLHGLAPGGTSYMITVTPGLATQLG